MASLEGIGIFKGSGAAIPFEEEEEEAVFGAEGAPEYLDVDEDEIEVEEPFLPEEGLLLPLLPFDALAESLAEVDGCDDEVEEEEEAGACEEDAGEEVEGGYE